MESIQELVDDFARHRVQQAEGDTDPVLAVIRNRRIISLLESPDTGQLLGLTRMAAPGL